MKNSVLVTGGAGFIGRHLVSQLLANGLSVTAFDTAFPHEEADLKAWAEGLTAIHGASFQYLTGSILSQNLLSYLAAEHELVVHLAAVSRVRAAEDSPQRAIDTNVLGTFNVLAAAAVHKRRVVFASSREVYGEMDSGKTAICESHRLAPKNVYGNTKLQAEQWCHYAHKNWQLPVVILRLANVYGPGDSGRVVPTFVRQALRDQPILCNGLVELDFVHVIDVCWAIKAAMFAHYSVLHPSAPVTDCACVINVGAGVGTSLPSLASHIVWRTHSKSVVDIGEYLPHDTRRFVADNSRMRDRLRVVPRTVPLYLDDIIASERTKLYGKPTAGGTA